MAAAPLVPEENNADAGATTPPAPLNPTPVSQPPITASNANPLTTESSQTPLTVQPPAPTAETAPAAPKTTISRAPMETPTMQTAAPQKAETPKADTKTKTQTPVSTIDQQIEALAGSSDVIKSMMEGNDPIATREFNFLINGTGPKNQLILDALGMKLKQNNLDGQGAGDALLGMLARDQGFEVDQMIAKIGSDSATRIYEFNKWGFGKAQELAVAKNKMQHDDFDAAIKNGQYDVAAGIWGDMFPGIPFDVGAAKANDPAIQDAFNNRSAFVKQLIDQGDAEGAKNAMIALAKEFPQQFGFKTPEEAVASLSGLDYSKEVWENNIAQNNKVTTEIRTAALQGDRDSAMLSIERWYANKLPGAAESEGKSLLGSLSLDEINAALKANDKAPITEAEKGSLSASEFAKDYKYFTEKKKASGANATDMILDQIVNFHPEVGMNPAMKDAARAWIFDNLAGANVTPDGSSLAGFTFKEGSTLPPWDPQFCQLPPVHRLAFRKLQRRWHREGDHVSGREPVQR